MNYIITELMGGAASFVIPVSILFIVAGIVLFVLFLSKYRKTQKQINVLSAEDREKNIEQIGKLGFWCGVFVLMCILSFVIFFFGANTFIDLLV